RIGHLIVGRGKLSGAVLLGTETTFFSYGEAENGEWKSASTALLLCLCEPGRLTDFAAPYISSWSDLGECIATRPSEPIDPTIALPRLSSGILQWSGPASRPLLRTSAPSRRSNRETRPTL